MKILISILTLILVVMLSTEGLAAQESPEDQLGYSLDIPQKTQEIMGLKTREVKSSLIAEKIAITGRIVQDVEEVVEVFSSESGLLKGCVASLGVAVTKGQVICRIENDSSTLIEIKAPMDGVVMADYVKAGDQVDTISPLQSIANLSKLPATFDVYEKDSGKIKMGQDVLIYSTAHPGEIFKGKIIFISPRIDESSFTVKIRVEIENTGLLLKPGLFVRGEIIIQDLQDHYIVPTDALQTLEGMNVVFLQDEKESFTPIKVEVKYASNKESSVMGNIKSGDFVVTDGAYALKSKILEDEISGGCNH